LFERFHQFKQILRASAWVLFYKLGGKVANTKTF
jgi:hypothetical protein